MNNDDRLTEDEIDALRRAAHLWHVTREILIEAGCPLETGCHVPYRLRNWLHARQGGVVPWSTLAGGSGNQQTYDHHELPNDLGIINVPDEAMIHPIPSPPAPLTQSKIMNQQLKLAINYIRNTGGNATKANFVEDYEPVGEMLWRDLEREGLAEIKEGKVVLTPKGEAEASA